MAKFEEKFADGVTNIHWAGNMVRVDFVTYQPTTDGKPPQAEVTHRLIMPPQGFLALLDSAQQLTGKLVDAGVLQKTEQRQ